MDAKSARWVFVGGMIRSGSTLQYQIASRLVEEHLGGSAIGFFEASEIDGKLDEIDAGAEVRFPCVVKSHVCTPGIRRRLQQGKAVAFYTYRDLRDVVVSASRAFSSDLDTFISGRGIDDAVGEGFLWTSLPGVHASAYETLMEDLGRWTGGMMGHLGIPEGDGGTARALAEEHSIERQRAKLESARFGNEGTYEVEASSLLHRHHIDRAAVGGWRDKLSAAQVAEIELRAWDWMEAHGYSRESEECSRDPLRSLRLRTACEVQEADRILLERELGLKEAVAEAEMLRGCLEAALTTLPPLRQLPGMIARRLASKLRGAFPGDRIGQK